jgi:hypothetical protein
LCTPSEARPERAIGCDLDRVKVDGCRAVEMVYLGIPSVIGEWKVLVKHQTSRLGPWALEDKLALQPKIDQAGEATPLDGQLEVGVGEDMFVAGRGGARTGNSLWSDQRSNARIIGLGEGQYSITWESLIQCIHGIGNVSSDLDDLLSCEAKRVHEDDRICRVWSEAVHRLGHRKERGQGAFQQFLGLRQSLSIDLKCVVHDHFDRGSRQYVVELVQEGIAPDVAELAPDHQCEVGETKMWLSPGVPEFRIVQRCEGGKVLCIS